MSETLPSFELRELRERALQAWWAEGKASVEAQAAYEAWSEALERDVDTAPDNKAALLRSNTERARFDVMVGFFESAAQQYFDVVQQAAYEKSPELETLVAESHEFRDYPVTDSRGRTQTLAEAIYRWIDLPGDRA